MLSANHIADRVAGDSPYQPSSGTLTALVGLCEVYLAPSTSVQACEGVEGMEFPDWVATALRSGAWNEWLHPDEGIYTKGDGQPL